MDIKFKRLNDTGELIKVSSGFREFYLEFIEVNGEKVLRKMFANALASNLPVEWGSFSTEDGKYYVEMKGAVVVIEPD